MNWVNTIKTLLTLVFVWSWTILIISQQIHHTQKLNWFSITNRSHHKCYQINNNYSIYAQHFHSEIGCISRLNIRCPYAPRKNRVHCTFDEYNTIDYIIYIQMTMQWTHSYCIEWDEMCWILCFAHKIMVIQFKSQ